MNFRDFKNRILFNFWHFKNDCYSQEGEDMIVKRFFEGEAPKGRFYVDVGAHHPKRFSNTYRFYRQGWSGINIDATPGSMKLFNIWRKNDVNLEIGVSGKEETLTFYMFNDPALNGFHQNLSENREGSRYYVTRKVDIPTFPLSMILDQHLPPGQFIDFMSVDVEGKDLEVLQSNDWNRYRPTLLLVESLSNSFDVLQELESHRYLTSIDYGLYAKTVNTLIYKDLRA